MTATSKDREELIGWIPELEALVTTLRLDRFVFRTVTGMLHRHPILAEERSEFFSWMFRAHVASTAVAIRRLTDDSTKAMSLRKILTCIKGNPRIIALDHYRSFFKDDRSPLIRHTGYVERSYTDLLSMDLSQPQNSPQPSLESPATVVTQPSAELIKNHLEMLDNAVKVINAYVDKRIAHYDREAPTDILQMTDLDAAIDVITRLMHWYDLLLTGREVEFDVVIQYNWTSVFAVAWDSESSRRFDQKE